MSKYEQMREQVAREFRDYYRDKKKLEKHYQRTDAGDYLADVYAKAQLNNIRIGGITLKELMDKLEEGGKLAIIDDTEILALKRPNIRRVIWQEE